MIRFLPIIAIALFSCTDQSEINQVSSTTNSNQQPKVENSVPRDKNGDTTNNAITTSDYSVKSTKQENGWGYEIYKGSKLVINQKNIPAVQGNQSFKTETDALKVGGFVVTKLMQNQFPPTLSLEELTSLGIEFKQ
jgi:hypothetical protein